MGPKPLPKRRKFRILLAAGALVVWAYQLGHLRVGVAGCNKDWTSYRLESKGRQWMLPCTYCWKKSPQYFQVWKLEQHHDNVLPTNPCLRIKFKYEQLTIFLQSTQPKDSNLPITFKLSLNCAGILFFFWVLIEWHSLHSTWRLHFLFVFSESPTILVMNFKFRYPSHHCWVIFLQGAAIVSTKITMFIHTLDILNRQKVYILGICHSYSIHMTDSQTLSCEWHMNDIYLAFQSYDRYKPGMCQSQGFPWKWAWHMPVSSFSIKMSYDWQIHGTAYAFMIFVS